MRIRTLNSGAGGSGALAVLNNNQFLQGKTTLAVVKDLIGINAANQVVIDRNGLNVLFFASVHVNGFLQVGTTPPAGGIISAESNGVDLPPFICQTNGSPGNYTPSNGIITLLDAAGLEILRIWATDPNPADFNSGNLYVGRQAGLSQPTDNVSAGSQNTGIGDSVLFSIQTGAGNSGLGFQCLFSVSTGQENTAAGALALFNNAGGSRNVAIGNGAGFSVPGNNISNNVLVGHSAGFSLVAFGDENTLLGYRAGFNIDIGAQNIMIGANVSASAPNVNNELNIGNALLGDTSTGALRFPFTARLGLFTVATLPAGTQGDTAFVTDAMGPVWGAPVVGLGASPVPVYHDGAVWNVG